MRNSTEKSQKICLIWGLTRQVQTHEILLSPPKDEDPGIAKRRRRLFRVIHPRPAVILEVRPEDDLWHFKGGRVSARGMILATAPVPVGRGGSLRLMLTPTKAIRPGQTYRIDIEQRVGGEVTGGMTYVVVVGEQKRTSD